MHLRAWFDIHDSYKNNFSGKKKKIQDDKYNEEEKKEFTRQLKIVHEAQGKKYEYIGDTFDTLPMSNVPEWWSILFGEKYDIVWDPSTPDSKIEFIRKNIVSKAQVTLQGQFGLKSRESKWTPEMLQIILNHLDAKRCESFNEWLRILYAARKVSETFPQEGLEMIIEWSKQSPKYTHGCVERVWKTPIRDGEACRINGGTLTYYFDEDCKDDIAKANFQGYFKQSKINKSRWEGWTENDIFKVKQLGDTSDLFENDYAGFFSQVFRKIWNGGSVQWYSLVRVKEHVEWKLTGNDIPIMKNSKNPIVRIHISEAEENYLKMENEVEELDASQLYKSKQLSKLLIQYQWDAVKQFDDAVFIPYIHDDPSNEHQFNLFQGYHQQYLRDDQYEKLAQSIREDIKIITQHIKKTLCRNNDTFYGYFINWLAGTLQKQKKLGVMMGFLSEEDAGKSMFFEWLRVFVYGLNYTHEVTDLNAICGRFNSRRENKVFTVLNEVQENQSSKMNDTLKAVITDKYFQVEKKGIEAYEAMCQSAFVALSNNFFMVKLSNSDRRYAVIECDSTHALQNNHAYFARLGKALNEQSGSWFFNMLARLDISKWDQRSIPETEYRKDLKLLSKANSLLHFLVGIVLGNNLEKPEIIVKNKLYIRWENWCQQSQVRQTYSPITFVRALKSKYGINAHMAVPTFEINHEWCGEVSISPIPVNPKRCSSVTLSIDIINHVFQHRLKYPNFDIRNDWIY